MIFLVGACSPQVTPVDYFHHQAWGTEEGVPQASVHAILQDQEGYLWIATESGIARFDGQNFRIYHRQTVPELVSDDITSIAEDKTGDLWFGTSGGLLRRHGQAFQRFSERDGLPSDAVVAIAGSGDDLLVLTAGGLARWTGANFRAFATTASVAGLSSSSAGPIIVQEDNHAFLLEQGRLIPLALPRGTTPPLSVASGNSVDLPSGPEGAAWTFTTGAVQHKQEWRAGQQLPGTHIQAVYVDAHGIAWVGTNRGLACIGSDGSVQQVEALREDSILSLAGDRQGDLWAGTEATGLHVLQPRKFAVVPGASHEAVTAVLRDSEGKLVYGTRDDGLFRSSPVPVPIAAGRLLSPIILSLAAGEHGEFWAGTPDGLNHIAGSQVGRWTIAEGLPDNFIRSVLAAPDGSVWAGTRRGLVHLEGTTVRTYTLADGLASDSIGPLLLSGENGGPQTLWAGTSAGLCRLEGTRFQCLNSPEHPGESVTALGSDHAHRIWVAIHQHGLNVVSGQGIVPIQSHSIPAEIVGILADISGHLWLRSPQGIFRVEIDALTGCARKSAVCDRLAVTAFGRSDGLPSEELAGAGASPLAEGPQGELWFATRRGIAVTDATHLRPAAAAPGIVINSVQVDGAEIDGAGPLTIGPGHRQYAVEYTGLSLNQPSGLRFRYWLEGLDGGWVEAGTRHTAYYTNLSPRRYVFHVMAINRDGVTSTETATLRFRVEAPWYRTAWAYLVAVLVSIALVYGVFRLRLRAQQARYELLLQERNRVAREVHDTLAQDLVSVSLQVEISSRHAQAGRMAEAGAQLAQTKLLVRQALDAARQSIWNLRANPAETSLPARLNARVEAYRASHGTAQLKIAGEYRTLSAELEDQVMRIAGEAMSNIERHANATEMSVELCYSTGELLLRVQDNGCGFDYATASNRPGHYGLQGLTERASMLDGRLDVEGVAGKGTVVTLVVPLSAEAKG